ncbi:MAG: hypothetical protein GF393_05855 [Armatimonadia bacterium]|nr:hypothetical protein [Armatimonadia bacterium]
MRKDWIKLVGMLALTFLMTGVLAGCGEQAQDTETDMPAMVDDDAGGTAPAEGGESAPGEESPTAEIPDNAETLADVVDSFTMPTSFRMTMSDGEREQTMAMMMDGQQATKLRVEQAGADASDVMIMDFEGGAMYSYNTGTNEGFKLPVSEEEAADAPMPYDDYDETAKVTGSEEIEGVECWVVETSEMGPEGETATVWIGKKDGLMRQVKQGEEVTTFTISDVNAVDASIFEVPGDVTFEEMPTQMGGPAPQGGPAPGGPMPEGE